MAALLTEQERVILKTELAHWALVPQRDAITRTYLFKDFKSAFAFMTLCMLRK
jgi:pterin-4a-carbinolamine dehydratase